MNFAKQVVLRPPRRPANVLDVFWVSFTRFLLQLFSRNANRWALYKLKQPFFYSSNGPLWMDEKKIIDKWVIVSKWHWCQINKNESCIGHVLHCTKNHISQVLEYHEKFKNTKKISTFHQLFRSKKDRISCLWKVQNNNFSLLKKHDIPCWRKYHLT